MLCLAWLIRWAIVAWHQERARDLDGGEAADGAQRERDRGGRRERAVAHEEQGEGVVPIHGGIGVGGGTKAHSAQTSLATASSRRRRATSL